MTLTFSDHIGNLTVELILASAEVTLYQQQIYYYFGKKSHWSRRWPPWPPFFGFTSYFRGIFLKVVGISWKYWTFRKEWFMQVTTLVRRRQPSLNTLNLLLEVEPFPGPDPESEFSFSFFCIVSFWLVCFLYCVCIIIYCSIWLCPITKIIHMNFVHIKREILLTTRSVF